MTIDDSLAFLQLPKLTELTLSNCLHNYERFIEALTPAQCPALRRLNLPSQKWLQVTPVYAPASASSPSAVKTKASGVKTKAAPRRPGPPPMLRDALAVTAVLDEREPREPLLFGNRAPAPAARPKRAVHGCLLVPPDRPMSSVHSGVANSGTQESNCVTVAVRHRLIQGLLRRGVVLAMGPFPFAIDYCSHVLRRDTSSREDCVCSCTPRQWPWPPRQPPSSSSSSSSSLSSSSYVSSPLLRLRDLLACSVAPDGVSSESCVDWTERVGSAGYYSDIGQRTFGGAVDILADPDIFL
jgi:hypothetical protein